METVSFFRCVKPKTQINSLANLKLEFVKDLGYYWGYDEIFLIRNNMASHASI